MINDELLDDGYRTLIAGLPPLVRNLTPTTLPGQAFRQRLYLAALGQPGELTADQIQAGQLGELLALTLTLTPPAFDPQKTAPGDLVQQRAQAFASQYLLSQYSATLSRVGMSAFRIQELLIKLEDLLLAQINHLPQNFHQQLAIATVLEDRKYRFGGLGALVVNHALPEAMADDQRALLGQVGENLATAAALREEVDRLGEADWFARRIRTGNYPLALLFCRTNRPDLVEKFFHQAHQPSAAAFDQLRLACQREGWQVGDLAKDLLKQVHYDLTTLPHGSRRDALTALLKDEKQFWQH